MFTNAIFLFSKARYISIFLFSLSIIFGKLLNLVPFVGFYIVVLLSEKNYKKVLSEVSRIKYGQTASYMDIANKSGDKKAVRAVGAANANNPIPIIIPCHRIIFSNGKIGGYGGGLEKKVFLLNQEGVDITL